MNFWSMMSPLYNTHVNVMSEKNENNSPFYFFMIILSSEADLEILLQFYVSNVILNLKKIYM